MFKSSEQVPSDVPAVLISTLIVTAWIITRFVSWTESARMTQRNLQDRDALRRTNLVGKKSAPICLLS